MKKNELTKNLLCESFIELMCQYPFQKITIKMITDGAGVIRPTFYGHFQDKIEILHYIIEVEIFSKLKELTEANMGKEAFKMLFYKLDQNSSFYKNAFLIGEPQYFEEVFINKVREIILLFFEKLHADDSVEDISIDTITGFYAISLTYVLKHWLLNKDSMSSEDLYKSYEFFINNSILDIVKKIV